MEDFLMFNDDSDLEWSGRAKVYIVIYKKNDKSPEDLITWGSAPEVKENFMNDAALICEERLFKTDFPDQDIKNKDTLYKKQGGYLYVKIIQEE